MIVRLDKDISNTDFYNQYFKTLASLCVGDSVEMLVKNTSGVLEKGTYIGYYSSQERAIVISALTWKHFSEYKKLYGADLYNKTLAEEVFTEEFIKDVVIDEKDRDEILEYLEHFELYELCSIVVNKFNK